MAKNLAEKYEEKPCSTCLLYGTVGVLSARVVPPLLMMPWFLEKWNFLPQKTNRYFRRNKKWQLNAFYYLIRIICVTSNLQIFTNISAKKYNISSIWKTKCHKIYYINFNLTSFFGCLNAPFGLIYDHSASLKRFLWEN